MEIEKQVKSIVDFWSSNLEIIKLSRKDKNDLIKKIIQLIEDIKSPLLGNLKCRIVNANGTKGIQRGLKS